MVTQTVNVIGAREGAGWGVKLFANSDVGGAVGSHDAVGDQDVGWVGTGRERADPDAGDRVAVGRVGDTHVTTGPGLSGNDNLSIR
jgi:hypothetical protein